MYVVCMCVHALFIKITRVFTICGGDVAPFISIISAEEFARAEAVAPLLICQLNVTENTRGGGNVDLVQVFLLFRRMLPSTPPSCNATTPSPH